LLLLLLRDENEVGVEVAEARDDVVGVEVDVEAELVQEVEVIVVVRSRRA
jgi:hypothetical protein